MSYRANLKNEVVAKLKAAGYNTKMVSVSVTHSRIEATIRNASVSHKTVSDIVKSFESISRCEASGEILCGGNTFTSVEISDAVAAEWAKKYTPAIEAALPEILALESGGMEVIDGFGIHKGQWDGYFYVVRYDNGFRTPNGTSVQKAALAMYLHSQEIQETVAA